MYPPPTYAPPKFDHWEAYCEQPTFYNSSWPAMSDSEMTEDSTPSPPFRMRDLLVDSVEGDDFMEYDDPVDDPHFPDSSADTFHLGGGFTGGYLDADSHNNGHIGRTSDEIQYRGMHEHALDVGARGHYGVDPDQFLSEQRQLEHVLRRAGPSTPADSALPPSAFHGPRVFPDPGEFLRGKLRLPPGAPVNLWTVPEPADPAMRPSIPYPLLVTLAIYGSESKCLTLQGIYREIADRFKYYRRQDALEIKSWRNSIRHALSLYALFINVPRPIREPGKGEYWVLGDINSDVLFTRLRKRGLKNKGAVTVKVEEDGDDSSRSDSPTDPGAPRKPRARAGRSTAPRKRRPNRAVSVDSDLNSEFTPVSDFHESNTHSVARGATGHLSLPSMANRIRYRTSSVTESTKPPTKKGRRTRA